MTQYNNKNLKILSAQLLLGTALIAGSAHAVVKVPAGKAEVLTGATDKDFIGHLNKKVDAKSKDDDKTAELSDNIKLDKDISEITNKEVDKVILKADKADITLDLDGKKGFSKKDGTVDAVLSGDNGLTIKNSNNKSKLASGNVIVNGKGHHTIDAEDVFTNDKDLTITEEASLTLNKKSTVNDLRIERVNSDAGLAVNADTTVKNTLLLEKGKIDLNEATLNAKNINVDKTATFNFGHKKGVLEVENGEISGQFSGEGTFKKVGSGKLSVGYIYSAKHVLADKTAIDAVEAQKEADSLKVVAEETEKAQAIADAKATAAKTRFDNVFANITKTEAVKDEALQKLNDLKAEFGKAKQAYDDAEAAFNADRGNPDLAKKGEEAFKLQETAEEARDKAEDALDQIENDLKAVKKEADDAKTKLGATTKEAADAKTKADDAKTKAGAANAAKEKAEKDAKAAKEDADKAPFDPTSFKGTGHVIAGTLEINKGSTAKDLNVEVSKGATLQGSGTIGNVVAHGRIMPGTGIVGSQPETLTVSSLKTEGPDAILQINVDKAVSDKLVVDGTFTTDGQCKIEINVSKDTKVDEKGLNVTEFLTAKSLKDSAGKDVTTPVDAQALFSKDKVNVTGSTILYKTVKLDPTFKSAELALSAVITDNTDTVMKSFANPEKARSLVIDYLEAALNDPKAQIAPNVRANLEKLAVELGELTLKDKVAANKRIDQLFGTGMVAAFEGAAITTALVGDAVSSHVSTVLGGAAIASTPAALVGNAFNRAEGSAIAKLAESGVSAGNVDQTLENGVWIKPVGAFVNLGTEGSNYGHRTNAAGVVVGADYHMNPESVVGVAVSYTHQNTKVKQDMGKATGRSIGATLYAATKWEDNIIDAALMVTSNRYTSKRTVGSEHATAKPKGVDFGARIGLGRLIRTETVDITPRAGINFLSMSRDAFKETGLSNSVANLKVEKTRLNIWTPSAGFTFSKAITTANGSWTPSLTIGWEALIPTGNKAMKLAFQDLGKYFTTNNVVKTRHMAVAGVGAAMDLSNGWNINFAYQAKVGKKINTHEVALKVGTRF